MKNHALLFGVLASAFATHTAALRAGLVTIRFSGTVGPPKGAAAIVFTQGDRFCGRFSYEDTTPDAALPAGATGQYGLGLSEFTIHFLNGGGTYYSVTKTSGFSADNLEVSDGVFDRVSVSVTGLPNPPGLAAGRLQIDFTDLGTPHAATTLDSVALPSPIDLESLSNQTGTWELSTFLTSIPLTVTSSAVVTPAATANLEWIAISSVSSGQVYLELQTESGVRYQIDHSPDGAIWTPWQTITATGPCQPFIDTPPAGSPIRFYRATRM